jgi:hypothetical protein
MAKVKEATTKECMGYESLNEAGATLRDSACGIVKGYIIHYF